METKNYDREFFKSLQGRNNNVPDQIVTLIKQWIRPRSLVDVGCGIGRWARHFRDAGVEDCWGEDGTWVPLDMLAIPRERFRLVDLTKPTTSTRRYDLAVCLEVAEHLPENSAGGLVDYLCGCSDVVLFSAAVPGQIGTNHLNEQWPHYWSALFERKGYTLKDIIRPKIFGMETQEYWYPQNALLFIKTSKIDLYKDALAKEVDWEGVSIVHPLLLKVWALNNQIHPKRAANYVIHHMISDISSRIKGRPYSRSAAVDTVIEKIQGYCSRRAK